MFTLVRLAPDHDEDADTAHRLAGGLAHILNTDDGLPAGMRRPAHLPPKTAEGVLAFTRQWCLERDAVHLALVTPDGDVAGAVTLSRVNPEAGSARLGYFLASAHHGSERHAAMAAFDFAKTMGIHEVSTTFAEEDAALCDLWRSIGHRVEVRDGRIVAYLA